MERLTIDEIIAHCKRKTEKIEKLMSIADLEARDMEELFMKEYWEHRQVAEWLEELKRYKDAEENGMLIHLPCRVGDTVYEQTPFCEICEEVLDNEYACEDCCRGKFITETKFDYEMIPMVGKMIFLTEAEAEQALKQMGE